MRCIDADIHKDIQRLNLRNIHRDQAAMGIVHQQVASQCSSGVVVDAASSISDITHDQCFRARAEPGQYIGNGGREQEQAFGKLKSDLLGPRASYAVYRLRDLERVIGREEGNGIVDFWVVEDVDWHLVQDASVLSGLSYCSDISKEVQQPQKTVANLVSPRCPRSYH